MESRGGRGVPNPFPHCPGADLIAGTSAGVYLSTDNGANWSPRSSGLPIGQARTLAAQGNTLITALYVPNESRGVFISTNNGTSWSPYDGGIGLNAVRTLVVNGNSVYAGTETQSIWSGQLGALIVLPTSVVSRKTHGTAGAFDINLPLTGSAGIECRNGGANSNYQVVFTFPTPVTLNGAVVTPQAGKLGNMAAAPSVSPDGRTVTLSLTNISDAQTIVMTLSGVSNGTSTNDVTLHMSLLVGDTNGNGVVNASDVSQTKSRSGQAITNANFRSDVVVNGAINASDVAMVKSRSGAGAP